MRGLAHTVVFVLATIGAAMAQDHQTANEAFSPRFETYAAHEPIYPQRGRAQRVAGIVHLCCQARPDRALACTIGVEWPHGRGFGDASLRLARGMHLTQESYSQMQARSLIAFRLPIRFQIAPAPPALDQVQSQIDAETVDLCGPNTGPAVQSEYVVVTGSEH